MLLVLLAACSLQAPDTATYLDPAARGLVARARAAREAQVAELSSYTAVAKQRIYAGLRALRRDRVLYHSEMAVRLHWRRGGPDTVEALGAREGIPFALPHDEVPEDLKGDAPDLLWDPASDRLAIGGDDSAFVHHPLAEGSEADYRFQSGDTTTITLADGREIRLFELKVLPRREDPHLMAGSLWLESRKFSLVRALFRLARPWDLERDLDAQSGEDVEKYVPGFMKPIKGELRFVTIEFELWDNRWWVPRLNALDGVGTAGTMFNIPIRFEIAYSDYSVVGDTTGAPPPPEPDSATLDSIWQRCKADTTGHCQCHRRRCHPVEVLLPADTMTLLTSADLPPSFVEDGAALATQADLNDLEAQLHLLPHVPSATSRPGIHAGLGAPGLIRYNRVEGLSLGARAEVPLAIGEGDATLRIGVADWQPDLDVGITRQTEGLQVRFGAYRRLNGVDPGARSLGFGNSVAALVLGRDDGDYFRSAGAEIKALPALTGSQFFEWRLYGEHQFVARRETEFSVAHLFDHSDLFRPTIAADRADQVGTSLLVHGDKQLAGGRAGIGGDAKMDLSVGTFGFARMALTGRALVPLPHALAAAVEVSGGTSAGIVPAQSRWYLGGASTLRGYGGNAMNGDAFWRGRAEVALGVPAARLALFTDAGWAGPRQDAFRARPLISAGVGASFLDGLLRVDVARALRAPKGWRLELYTDAVL